MRGSRAKALRKMVKNLATKKETDYDVTFVRPSNKTIMLRLDMFKNGLLYSTDQVAQKVALIKLKEDCFRYLYQTTKKRYKMGGLTNV